MAVFNVTKLEPTAAKVVAQFLGVSKVEIRYSDWMNEFGVYIKNKSEVASVSENKRKIAKEYVTSLLDRTSANELASCPRINKRKEKTNVR